MVILSHKNVLETKFVAHVHLLKDFLFFLNLFLHDAFV